MERHLSATASSVETIETLDNVVRCHLLTGRRDFDVRAKSIVVVIRVVGKFVRVVPPQIVVRLG
jgi:hypothetical protein